MANASINVTLVFDVFPYFTYGGRKVDCAVPAGLIQAIEQTKTMKDAEE
jgi:hypothetical protein